ncbi:MAG: exodeoxyribonuclease VII small subunit [Gammaproteobacteria bacterium]|nr:MAG: exodeoxyribonuclease VII small subunit [Gammaproteobacteria bacterium]
MAAKTTKSFEKSLSELEKIVEKMENGDLSLEESMKQFEKGVELTRVCQTVLDQAEQKVKLLSTDEGDSSEADFTIDQ